MSENHQIDLSRLLPLVWRAIQHRSTIMELLNVLTPLFNEIMRTGPIAWPIIRTLGAELFPEMQMIVSEHAPIASFDTRWLQTSLNSLMDAKLAVDGKYGNATRQAVEAFQVKYMGPSEADGWAGPRTTAHLYIEMEKAKHGGKSSDGAP